MATARKPAWQSVVLRGKLPPALLSRSYVVVSSLSRRARTARQRCGGRPRPPPRRTRAARCRQRQCRTCGRAPALRTMVRTGRADRRGRAATGAAGARFRRRCTGSAGSNAVRRLSPRRRRTRPTVAVDTPNLEGSAGAPFGRLGLVGRGSAGGREADQLMDRVGWARAMILVNVG